MEDQIKQLEENIERQKKELQIQRVLLAAAKKKQKENTPFSQTTLGKAWYGTLRTLTKPFSDLHANAHKNLEHPHEVIQEKFLKRAEKLLSRAKELNREEEEKQATMTAVLMAELVMECEDYMEGRGIHLQPFFIGDLRDEIERLRPPRDLEKEKELEKFAKELIDLGEKTFTTE